MEQTVGSILKQARIRQNRTLSDITASTHIRNRFLEALENDELDLIPSQAQARGFLRLYASTLGLAPDTLLTIWDTPDSETDAEPPITPKSDSQIKKHLDNLKNAIQNFTFHLPESILNRFPTLRNISSTIDDSTPSNESILLEDTPSEIEISDDIFEEPSFVPNSNESPTYISECLAIGLELKSRREALTLSLDDVELHTRLKRHHLASLENGRLDDLPSPVQARGMLSNYIEYLNLDSDKLLSRYANALQIRRKAYADSVSATPHGKRIKKEATNSIQTTSKKGVGRIPILNFISADLIVGGFLILALFGFVIWGAFQIINSRSAEIPPEAPSISEILMTTPSLTPELSLTIQSDATVSTTPEIQVPNEGGEITSTPVPTSSAPLQVVIVANSRGYLLVTVDGSVRFSGRVNPGDVQTFSGTTRISVESGNAGAFQVIFNQDDLGSLGEMGQILRLVFTSEGVQTPTPQFSITPTNTQPATLTPQPSPTMPTSTVTPLIP